MNILPLLALVITIVSEARTLGQRVSYGNFITVLFGQSCTYFMTVVQFTVPNSW